MLSGFTIDPAHAKDLDDALWIKNNKLYIVISNVAKTIKLNSELDLYAKSKVISKYYSETEIDPMLPPDLSENYLSLLPDQKRSVVAFEINIEKNDVISFKLHPDKQFISSNKLSYQDIPIILKNKNHPLHQQLQQLSEIAEKLYDTRATNLWHTSNYFADEDLIVYYKNDIDNSIGHLIVQELMILANTFVSNYIASYDVPILFRVQKNINSKAHYEAIPGYHCGLDLDIYTHYTSPIRRYTDLVNQRQIDSFIRYGTLRLVYSLDQIKELADYINKKLGLI